MVAMQAYDMLVQRPVGGNMPAGVRESGAASPCWMKAQGCSKMCGCQPRMVAIHRGLKSSPLSPAPPMDFGPDPQRVFQWKLGAFVDLGLSASA